MGLAHSVGRGYQAPMLNLIEHGTTTAAPTLIIAHGLYGSARNWGVIAKRLSDERKVVAVDMRNHGLSPWSNTHRYEDLASDLAEVVSHIGGPVDVLGHSMGGKAAMMLALTRPTGLRKLIVADIAPVTYSHSQLKFIDAMKTVRLDTLSRRSEAENDLAQAGVEPALQSFFTQSLDIAEKRWRLNLDALADQMPYIMSFPQTSAQWDGPVLMLSGADSDYVLSDHRPLIRARFPHAVFAKIPGAGHWLHAEKPREFEAAVRAYLNA